MNNGQKQEDFTQKGMCLTGYFSVAALSKKAQKLWALSGFSLE